MSAYDGYMCILEEWRTRVCVCQGFHKNFLANPVSRNYVTGQN